MAEEAEGFEREDQELNACYRAQIRAEGGEGRGDGGGGVEVGDGGSEGRS